MNYPKVELPNLHFFHNTHDKVNGTFVLSKEISSDKEYSNFIIQNIENFKLDELNKKKKIEEKKKKIEYENYEKGRIIGKIEDRLKHENETRRVSSRKKSMTRIIKDFVDENGPSPCVATIINWFRKLSNKNSMDQEEKKNKRGRPRCTTIEQDIKIRDKRIEREDRPMTSKQIAIIIEEEEKIKITDRTVRNRFYENGFTYKK